MSNESDKADRSTAKTTTDELVRDMKRRGLAGAALAERAAFLKERESALAADLAAAIETESELLAEAEKAGKALVEGTARPDDVGKAEDRHARQRDRRQRVEAALAQARHELAEAERAIAWQKEADARAGHEEIARELAGEAEQTIEEFIRLTVRQSELLRNLGTLAARHRERCRLAGLPKGHSFQALAARLGKAWPWKPEITHSEAPARFLREILNGMGSTTMHPTWKDRFNILPD